MLALPVATALAVPADARIVCDSGRAAPPDESAELAAWFATRDPRMAWWREARFGMFIHWGLYSPAGGFWNGKRYEQHYAEWIQHWAAVPCAEYAREMKPRFMPEAGFADAWAELAEAAGMRYAVLTANWVETKAYAPALGLTPASPSTNSSGSQGTT